MSSTERSVLIPIIAITCLWGCAPGKQATSVAVPEDPRWKTIDSLSDIGLYGSALVITEDILKQARGTANWRTQFKASMHRAKFQEMTGIDELTVIKELEELVSSPAVKASIPLEQLYHSVLGEAYWSYYQQNRWRILDRTNIEGGNEEDVATWDQRRMMQQIIHHFKASLQPFDTLRHIPAGELGTLLEWPLKEPRPQPGGPYTRSGDFSEPLLIDILARRAIAILSNGETGLALPGRGFQIDDARYFKLFEDFVLADPPNNDTLSLEYQALRTYQQWERAHLSDDDPNILTDITLSRLDFVRRNATLEGKDELYYNALVALRMRTTELPVWSQVTLAMAQWHGERAEQFQRLDPGELKWEKRTAVQLCDSAIIKFPGSFGAQKALALKTQLLLPALDLAMEEAVLPETPFKLAFGYMNTTQVWLKIVADEADMENDQRDWNVRLEHLLQREAIRQWSVELPADSDHYRHLVELPVEGLPAGRYAAIVSDHAQMDPERGPVVFTSFWSTRISVAERTLNDQHELLLLDRNNGKALSGAKAELFTMDHGRSGRQFTRQEEFIADAEGKVRTHRSQENTSSTSRWQITLDDGDRYITGSRWSGYHRDHEPDSAAIRTFLFTDRAIYRPGQEIFFKGIITSGNKGTHVVTDRRTVVKIFDANEQLMDSLEVTSDHFGAFHGKFRAPGGLTGHMRIEEKNGSVGIIVEEYKRPKFEVVFDPITTTAKLNEEAEVTAAVISYAGVPIDNAEVKWTVTRMARMPWWSGRDLWGGHPGWGRPVEISNGSTTTDPDGKFSVEFIATPDRSLPKRAEPIFTYTVEAFVTDINGETQGNTTSLSLGHKSIEIAPGIGDAIDRSTTDQFEITIRNLNGEKISRPVDIQIQRLQEPESPIRERRWERPDRFVIDRDRHTELFPFDPYDQEGDPMYWEPDSTVLELQQWNSTSGPIPFQNIEDWPVGMYRLDVRTTDPDGNEVDIQKTFNLYDPEIQNTGFLAELFHVQPLTGPDSAAHQPGDKARLLMSTALPEGRIGMDIEREGRIVASRWHTLRSGQQLMEIPVLETDRGGFIVHFIAVALGREYRWSQRIDVPWTNKELKVEWLTFRDKTLPGAAEEFRLKINGAEGDRVAAQVLASMYDASLDHFVPHSWEMFRWPQYHARASWSGMEPFGTAHGSQAGSHQNAPRDTLRAYPDLRTYGWPADHHLREVMFMDASGGHLLRNQAGVVMAEDLDVEYEVTAEKAPSVEIGPTQVVQPVRRNFSETAFFFPDLQTDSDGAVVLRTTMPEALTRWRLMGLAHTTDLRIASFSKEVITQKPMMLVPGLPRFLRHGDRIALTCKINVLEGDTVTGNVSLELFDPITGRDVAGQFKLQEPRTSFTATKGSSFSTGWNIEIPDGIEMVGIRMIAQGDQNVSDGEEHILPILTDRVLVTESLPLSINKAGTKTFEFNKLLSSGASTDSAKTLKHHGLQLEFTPEPIWYVVQALPYLIEFPHECSEQIFSRYYANELAAQIVQKRPGIKNVVDAWRAAAAAGGDELKSALEKNPELKSIILEETPWVMRAKDEGERKQRIALLFDLDRMSREGTVALRKLHELQLENGAWPWFKGMLPSRQITQHIVAGMGHLRSHGIPVNDPGGTQQMVYRAIHWLDNEVVRYYEQLQDELSAEELAEHVPGYTEVHYLYARSFFTERPYEPGAEEASRFFRQRISSEWLKYGLQEQTMIAMAIHRMEGQASEVPMQILRSLKERATQSEELGMYWRNFSPGMHWSNFPTETHALAIEAFHEIAGDISAVNGLRTHLLKLKQTTDWGTTKATAHACHAILLTGDDLLTEAPPPQITIGGELFSMENGEAGTGYITHTWTADQISPEMGNVTINSSTDRVSWGALHWQYFEQMDKVTPHESPFSIQKEIMIRQQSDAGAILVPLDQAGNIQVGDRISIRIELRTDRPVDFVHLKDLRAAGLEPVETLSGHKWQGGLGYYQSIRDAGMHFFFDRIPPGTHVFEYDLHVTQAGDLSNGITTAMCMYAPEFSSHSAGQRIEISRE